jgi:hypothetical protein
MDACPRCGARVAGDATWCGQCFAPLAKVEGSRVRVGAGSMRTPPPREGAHEPTYSRWRGSATSFGPMGRVLVSVAAVLGLAIGYPIARGLILVTAGVDVPGTGFLFMYLAIAITAGLYLFSRIWKPTRVT